MRGMHHERIFQHKTSLFDSFWVFRPGLYSDGNQTGSFCSNCEIRHACKRRRPAYYQTGLLNRTHVVSQSAFQTNSSFDSFGNASANIFMPHFSEQHLLQSFRQISEIPTLPVDLHLEKKMDDFFATIKKKPVKLHSRRS